MHHIVTDGWSMVVLNQELGALYEAYSTRCPSPLPELPIQYADYTLWQQDLLREDVLNAHVTFWTRQLSGATTLLNLPTDRPREAVRSFRGARLPVLFPKSLNRPLQTLNQREGVTLFMTLFAAFQILLHRYTEQDDIVVGTFVANRNSSDVERLIGFFVNNLVLRTDLSGNPTFFELLRRTRETTLGAFSHQAFLLNGLLRSCEINE